MARVNADLGNPMQSIELLGIARHLSQTAIPSTVLAKLHSMEAKTHAILGQPAECERAIGRAEHQMQNGSMEESPAWIDYFDLPQLAGVIGSCYRDLAQSDERYGSKAETEIARAMLARRAGQVRNRALDHVNLATVRLHVGEIDGMVEAANEAVRLAETLKSYRVNTRLHGLSVRAAKKGHNHQPVQGMCERVAELSMAGL